jgi:peptidoglycan/xylan/chitin deacetylase (PgdA/CDA1 family)
MYLIKTPWWLRAVYPFFIWKINTDEKVLYLTFDDGPHKTATPFVLDELKKYNAKATFFCVGNNVVIHSDIYQRILEEGHAVGNHTYHHLNGWKSTDKLYIKDIYEAAREIDSSLFRPPYGRIKKFQAKLLGGVKLEEGNQNARVKNGEMEDINYEQETISEEPALNRIPFSIIMWDVLSGDFDTKLLPKECLENVVLNAGPGSIIVFHDSTKAWDRMSFALPGVLEYFSRMGYLFKALGGL